MSRRSLRTLVTSLALALPLAACSTGPAEQAEPATTPSAVDAGAFPVTIRNVFGTTTIDSQPTRVATVSWVNADVALALGVVPVGMPKDEWGGNKHFSTPWKDAALKKLGAPIGSSTAPAQYSEIDGVNYTEIAKTSPDVILATYSGLTKEEYTKLSKIAPVVGYPKLAYGTPWQESTRLIGKALGKEAEARALVAKTEKTIADKVAEYPQIKGKTFIYANLDPSAAESVNIYTGADNRPRFLKSIDMIQAPVVDQNTKQDDTFYIPWSAERANELKSDVLVTWVPDDKTVKQIEDDPLLGQIPAIKRGAWVADSDNTLTLSVSAANPLSLPWALDKFLPMLGAAADKA